MPSSDNPEQDRISTPKRSQWRRWGPYLSDRAWGTVREDYSFPDPNPWSSFSHDAARMRAFRWGEDGIGGFCDDRQLLCTSLVLWNERDPILKERFFGLINGQGNHGEDVKELYHYLDCTPSASYARMLYRYPQVEYPYVALIDQNRTGLDQPEVELFDVLAKELRAGQYFDVSIEYAKLGAEDILCRIRAVNRGAAKAPLHLLPQLWFRNTWSWEAAGSALASAPQLKKVSAGGVQTSAPHPELGDRFWYAEDASGAPPDLLFTENDSNTERLGSPSNGGKYFKDAFHLYLARNEYARYGGSRASPRDWVNPAGEGSKVAAHFSKVLEPGETWELRLRLSDTAQAQPFQGFDAAFATRIEEADSFYEAVQGAVTGATDTETSDLRRVQRQALAGLLWNQQFYYYSVDRWLKGDPASRPPDPGRAGSGQRNVDWRLLDAMDVILMPDPWEYPWFAGWDLAFHCVAISLVDPALAKSQLLLLTQENYMQPSGQLPAYEWNFGDLNPPVTAWAALHVYQRDKRRGSVDRDFLLRIFNKSLLYFTWWVNRVDSDGDNVFAGGFLGLDNISVIDRSSLSNGQRIDQADGTAWVAMFCATLFSMAAELALGDPAYEDLAIKFLDHYTYVARALVRPEQIRSDLEPLWDEGAGFFFDHLYTPGAQSDIHITLRSVAGLVPLFATVAIPPSTWAALPRLDSHRAWLAARHGDLLPNLTPPAGVAGGPSLLSLVDGKMLAAILAVVLDEARLLSRYGVRSLSKEHTGQNSFQVPQFNGATQRWEASEKTVRYDPAEVSYDPQKGGNSNWRGPIWVAINYLLVQSLRTFHSYHGGNYQVTLRLEGGGTRRVTLDEAATEISERVLKLVRLDDAQKTRPIFAPYSLFEDLGWNNELLFHEYFDGETGKGLGAAHQGWTSLLANLIDER